MEVGCVLEATPLAVVAGVVESDPVKAKCLGVFMEAFRYRRMFMEVDRGSEDKVDTVECRCILAPLIV